jgi:hypothetical protein
MKNTLSTRMAWNPRKEQKKFLITTKGVGNSKYHVTCQYTARVDGSPTQFETRVSISAVNYSKFQVGAEIEILYIPSAPEISEPKMGFGPPSITGILFLAAVAVGVAWYGAGVIYSR